MTGVQTCALPILAEGDGSAVHVHDAVRYPQGVHRRQGHGGECLVDLQQVQVGDGHAGLLEGQGDGVAGLVEEAGVGPGHLAVGDRS